MAVGSVTIAGRWLLNPMFRLLAAARAREVMTAAALLVVLGAALLMQFGGLSMAMGAFLAGVMLSESSFRHQLEADIEPFRGILLGLFFLSVGMSLDLTVFASHWPQVLGGVVVFMLVKAAGIYAVARVLGAPHGDALHRMVLMAQGGEFAFVLYSAGVQRRAAGGPDACGTHRDRDPVDGPDAAGGRCAALDAARAAPRRSRAWTGPTASAAAC